jgi:hypothetical protein
VPGPRTPRGQGQGYGNVRHQIARQGCVHWVGTAGWIPASPEPSPAHATAERFRVLQAIPEGRMRRGVRIPHIHRISHIHRLNQRIP